MPAAIEPLTVDVSDLGEERPISDELFRAYRSHFVYDRTDLHSRVELHEDTDEWTRERISFDAAYGGERVIACLYLPRSARLLAFSIGPPNRGSRCARCGDGRGARFMVS